MENILQNSEQFYFKKVTLELRLLPTVIALGFLLFGIQSLLLVYYVYMLYFLWFNVGDVANILAFGVSILLKWPLKIGKVFLKIYNKCISKKVS